MAERILVYDMSGNVVVDPENSIDRAVNITFSTAAPKGYMEASFQVKRSDIFADWVVRESYGVIIWDGNTICYQGRIETMPYNLGGSDEYITVQCVGWYAVLEERPIRKRWIDIQGITQLRWPDGLTTSEMQTSFLSNKREGTILQVVVAAGDVSRPRYYKYRELYELPSGYIRRLTFDYILRSGEHIVLAVNNMATHPNNGGYILSETVKDGWEWSQVSTSTAVSGSVTVTPALGNTGSVEFWVYLNDSDEYDQNDYAHWSNLRVEAQYEAGHRTAAPTYTQGQIIEDVILLANQQGAQLSTDFAQLGDPGLILDPFAVEEPEYCSSVIERILAYGDASLNTWQLYVWDQSDTSDGKPRVVLTARSIADWEYEVTLSARELAGFTYEKISDELWNAAIVQYQNERKETRYRTSTDNAALADATSIANEYRRTKYLKLGAGDATRADYLGQRYVQYHKDRLTRATIEIQGYVKNKGRGKTPANRVRAGQRIKLVNTGEIFFIRHTSYDAETQTVRISPDMPVDNVAMLFVQREREMGKLAK